MFIQLSKKFVFLTDNVPLFSVKSAFCNKFIVSFLLIKLIIQNN